jgi:hypothetical protein
MMLRAPWTEALLGIALIQGFGVLSLDGSLFPLGSTATYETAGVSKTLWGEVEAPDATGSKPVDQEARHH